MFDKKTIYVQAEYTYQDVSLPTPHASHLRTEKKPEASGAEEKEVLAGAFASHKSCGNTLVQDAVAERLRTFLSTRISERVTLKELSHLLGYSEKYASDVFRRYMGSSLSKHVKELRLSKATSMLLEERHTITTIAESVGFSDAFAFSHFFKRAVGCSPTEYRRQQLHQSDMA